MAEDEEQ